MDDRWERAYERRQETEKAARLSTLEQMRRSSRPRAPRNPLSNRPLSPSETLRRLETELDVQRERVADLSEELNRAERAVTSLEARIVVLRAEIAVEEPTQ